MEQTDDDEEDHPPHCPSWEDLIEQIDDEENHPPHCPSWEDLTEQTDDEEVRKERDTF